MHVLALALLLIPAIGAPPGQQRPDCEPTRFQQPDLERHPAVESPDGTLRVVLGRNVFAIRWMNGSRELLMAVEVYPTGDCGRHLGRFGGYLVRVEDGAILKRYTEAQLRPLWPERCRD